MIVFLYVGFFVMRVCLFVDMLVVVYKFVVKVLEELVVFDSGSFDCWLLGGDILFVYKKLYFDVVVMYFDGNSFMIFFYVK